MMSTVNQPSSEMSPMDIRRGSVIERTTSADDWRVVRECYIAAFRHYPLYEYLVPGDVARRDRFMRAYLDANYDVTVASGRGVLLAVRAPAGGGEMKTVGGVVFVAPSSDGKGWEVGSSDEPYWRAYRAHGLAQISPQAFERVKRYEAWEHRHVTEHVMRSKLAMWNGLFCAIEPGHASRGLGRALFADAIRIIAPRDRKTPAAKPAPSRSSSSGGLRRLAAHLISKRFHLYTLLSHRRLPPIGADPTKIIDVRPTMTPKDKRLSAPLVVAFSHCERSARFHVSNGFRQVALVPFRDPVDDVTPFDVHVLALDPFRTGRIADFRDLLSPALQRLSSS